ncbi:MAG: PD40 domain-containing protein [Chitinophagaceae bacterium]|nr:PD40 domain-containing protein [Anaerolineae bacterium]
MSSIFLRVRRFIPLILMSVLFTLTLSQAAQAQVNTTFRQVCPVEAIQLRADDFQASGLILTTFDGIRLWVYDVIRDRRYPLENTNTCGAHCHLSPDFRWISYLDATNGYSKMRLDGSERIALVDYASEVSWWSATTLLVWTPDHQAYLQREDGLSRQILDSHGIVNIQPGGHWGLYVERDEELFIRSLFDLDGDEERVPLGVDLPYFNAASWSPDGEWLAYVAPNTNSGIISSEIFAIRPADAVPIQWTNLTAEYGAVRINGRAVGELSWSPDATHLAFWVIPLTGANPEVDTGNAILHILDVETGEMNVYCDLGITAHTPVPPRLIWSPDGAYIAFGANIDGNEEGNLLLAVNVADGTFTQLSAGIAPALGSPDVVAWGLPPQ